MANRPKPNAAGVGNTDLAISRQRQLAAQDLPDAALDRSRCRLAADPIALAVFEDAVEALSGLITAVNVTDIETLGRSWSEYLTAQEHLATHGDPIMDEGSGRWYENPAAKKARNAYKVIESIKKQYGLTLDAKMRLGLTAAVAGSLVSSMNEETAAAVARYFTGGNRG
jgi:P27 family predicted phage terminase small subunit